MLRVFIDSKFAPEINWTIDLISKDQAFKFQLTDVKEDADLVFGSQEGEIPVNSSFFSDMLGGKTRSNLHFSEDPFIRDGNGQVDYLSTIFYLVNCLQEYNYLDSELDRYNRFPYRKSIQAKFKITRQNYVSDLIDQFMQSIPILREKQKSIPHKSEIFLSHDIDSLYGSLFFDGKWALKHLKLGKLMQLFWNVVIRKPAWFNIDKIMDIHSEYDMCSTFFWILSHGRDEHGIKNGDYNAKSNLIQDQMKSISKRDFGLGIHKSTMKTGFEEELANSPVSIKTNRYHFLKFKLPEAWDEIENSRIKLDCSLGFAEEIGFRNSYGRPFRPYNLKERRPYNLVEQPLHIMDGTFVYYQHKRDQSVFKEIQEFIEQNKYNQALSILWHNNELSPFFYGSMFENYKQLLAYLYEENFETITEAKILSSFDDV